MITVLAAAVLLTAVPSDSQTMRLVGLARAWGYVKYVHPALATSGLDWDAALVRALPAVERARSDAEYRRAIGDLLLELHDPATRVVAEASSAAAGSSRAIRLEAIDSRTAVVEVPSDPAVEASAQLDADVCSRFGEANRFERVVIDLRGSGGPRAGWRLKHAIAKCAGRLLTSDVTLAPARFLTHGFYPMQSVTGGAGGGLGPWESGITVAAAGSVRAEGTRPSRLAFIVDRSTADVYALLMALQDQGTAWVVQEGEVPDAGLLVTTFEVGDGLTLSVRHGERLRRDGTSGFRPDAEVAGGRADAARRQAIALLDARPREAVRAGRVPFVAEAFIERDYSEPPYPDRAHRLLGLFRLWSVIEYFFPYRPLMDQPWRETLAEFVPRMSGARDATDHALAVAELAVRIQDSHVTIASPVLDAYFGTHRPSVRVDRVEGETVITEIGPELAPSGVRVGDLVLSVDGEDTSARRARLARYLPASTPGRLENKIDVQFLVGPVSRPAVIEARGAEGTVRRFTAPRTLEGLAPRARTRPMPVYTVLSSGHGYVDLQRLEAKDVGAAFETIASTPGAIFDMRGYPVSGAWAAIPRLARAGVTPGAIGGSMRYDGATAEFRLAEELAPFEAEAAGPRYPGRIVVLADGSSQSAAEHVCLLIKSASAATFVGSPTSGANGAVTRTILPGGIVVNFSGQSVRHADGRPLQRVGIIPDVEAHPTLVGVRAGRDEVLEAAVRFLEQAS